MMPKLYLHIGSPKTGSTSIQEIFSHNRRGLEKQGFVYPGKNPDHHFIYFASKASRTKWPRHFKGIDPNKLKAYLVNYFSGLEKDFKKEANIIMSTEYIFFDDERLVKNIVDYLRQFFANIEVFCFLREPTDYYKSYQQQLIKGQSYIQSPQTFKYEFKKVVKTWSSLCDNMQVLEFKKSENSFMKFCERIGIDTNYLTHLDHRIKGSISVEQMTIMEKVYREIYSAYDDQLTGKLHVKTLARIKAPFATKPELQEWVKSIIYNNHLQDLRWLKEEYGIDFLKEYSVCAELKNLPTFKDGKASVRDVYKLSSENSVEKYEALVIDALLKKLVNNGKN